VLFDSHCHLDAFDDRDAVIERARAAGVTRLLVPGVDHAQWERSIDSDVIEIVRAIGLHPQAIEDGSATEFVARAAAAVAIGELGWDKKRASASMDTQDTIARAQLVIARELDLPVILHIVGAHGHALQELEAFGPIRGVVHSYSGPADLVARYCALGLSISLGPSVTLPNARKPIEAAMATPIDRLLVETDAPYQFPASREDRRGEPSDLVEVVHTIARARNESFDHIAERSFANASQLFG
jgi:TatD DNase family protein